MVQTVAFLLMEFFFWATFFIEVIGGTDREKN